MRRILLTVLMSLPLLALAPTTAARAEPVSPPADAQAAVGVKMAAYHLGNKAFVDPTITEYDGEGAVVPMELTAAVYYPSNVRSGTHPLIVLEHGSWWTCTDKARGKPTGQWPCKKGTVPLRSYRGYDYLARELAAQGFVVASISANAINAHVLGDVGYKARAHLVNKHLEMWQQLASGHGGPLRGRFVDPTTGKQVTPRFGGHVDMRNVGTLGHSRGGKGVMWQASDKHRSEWPAGVRVRGVVGLAPVHFTPPGETNRDTRVTKVPFLVVTSQCDGDVGNESGRQYVGDTLGLNPDASTVSIKGGNHSYFNTRWSPGQIGGADDTIADCPAPIGPVDQRSQTVDLIVPWFVDHLL